MSAESTDPTIDPDLKSLLDSIIETFRVEFQKSESEGLQRFFVVNKSTRTIFGILQHYSNPAEKEAGVHEIASAASKFEADCIISILEAWSLSAEDSKNFRSILSKYGSISNYPGKIEVINVMLETNLGVWAAAAPISEDSGGKRDFGPLDLNYLDGATGRFIGLLPPKGPKTVH